MSDLLPLPPARWKRTRDLLSVRPELDASDTRESLRHGSTANGGWDLSCTARNTARTKRLSPRHALDRFSTPPPQQPLHPPVFLRWRKTKEQKTAAAPTSSTAFMKAEPTTTPSAMQATSWTCSMELMPNPTDRGLSVAERTRPTKSLRSAGRPDRAPVTPATLCVCVCARAVRFLRPR